AAIVSLALVQAVVSAYARLAASPVSRAHVKALLCEHGCSKLKFEDVRWKTGSSRGAGKRCDVGVGPCGGGIYADGVPSKWSEAQVWVTAARRVVFGIIARNKKSPSLWDGD
ncbi:hypothetical protein, partial [Xanthomonas translucens]